MIYTIRRNKDTLDKKPIKGCKQIDSFWLDERAMSEEEFNFRKLGNDNKLWKEEGYDHTTSLNKISRKMDFKIWIKEFNSLEELNKFIQINGNCNITPPDDWSGGNFILIFE